MTKATEETRFIELRGSGLSFQKISEELNVSKSTLLKWQAKYSSQLAEYRLFETQAVFEQYKVMRSARLERFSSLLHSVLQELENRQDKLKDIPTVKLLTMALTLENRLIQEIAGSTIPTLWTGEIDLISNRPDIQPD